MRRGGAEQVARCFHHAFPEAPIYTLAYNPAKTYPDFKNSRVITSWLQKVARDENKMKKLFFPFGLLAMHQLDVTAYDVILISSTYCAKYVKISPRALVINYCHQPFRLAWYPESYAEFLRAKGLQKVILKSIVAVLKHYDYRAAQRTDYFIANTPETKDKIQTIYAHPGDIAVIYPPVNSSQFAISTRPKNYYLVVARLEYYKRVDLIIDAFNLSGLPLIIVGKGSKEKELKSRAKENINFKSELTTEELQTLYADCRALIFPQHEDFGITPLEANAAGRPVVAYGAGGVLHTMIPFTNAIKASTAIFFYRQDVTSLTQAVERMEAHYHAFDPVFIRQNALRFEESNFVNAIKRFVATTYQRQSLAE